ncbi:hypothetical protein P5P86_13655 [Nocardioides sp. BP30]|uniref:hypothetical protein n=1 Tax=Nocardioides sp. BP30 TaxID=3036374 RepID=UPI0024698286|nr:hypothetical protein [Nocardioides sp. BP30]WGL51008.1 hypothetical protein P5P86_13655 [Nocardioides sp. BP30]
MAARTPRFAELVDWVEGRLSATRAAEIEAQAAHDPETAEAAAWIGSFHDAARVMPLETPPEPARAALRALVAERTAPWRPTAYSVGALALNGAAATARGTRSTDLDAGVASILDLVFETELGAVRLTVLPGPDGNLVRVTTERPLPADPSTRLVLTDGERVRATGTPVAATELEARDVRGDVDAVWLVHGEGRIRLDLPQR